jgi:hypothetical protein
MPSAWAIVASADLREFREKMPAEITAKTERDADGKTRERILERLQTHP